MSQNTVATRISRANLSFSQGRQVRFVGRVTNMQGKNFILEATDGHSVNIKKLSDDLNGQNLIGSVVEVIGVVEGPDTIQESRTFLWGDLDFKQYEEMLRVCTSHQVFA